MFRVSINKLRPIARSIQSASRIIQPFKNNKAKIIVPTVLSSIGGAYCYQKYYIAPQNCIAEQKLTELKAKNTNVKQYYFDDFWYKNRIEFIVVINENSKETYVFHKNGKLKTIYTTNYGYLSGQYNSYHTDGSEKINCTFDGGYIVGKYTEKYQNGSMKIDCTLTDKNNEKHKTEFYKFNNPRITEYTSNYMSGKTHKKLTTNGDMKILEIYYDNEQNSLLGKVIYKQNGDDYDCVSYQLNYSNGQTKKHVFNIPYCVFTYIHPRTIHEYDRNGDLQLVMDIYSDVNPVSDGGYSDINYNIKKYKNNQLIYEGKPSTYELSDVYNWEDELHYYFDGGFLLNDQTQYRFDYHDDNVSCDNMIHEYIESLYIPL